MRSREDEYSRREFIDWIRGFISGYNWSYPEYQVAVKPDLDPHTISLFIDKFCRDNPLKGLPHAAIDLVNELASGSKKK